MDTNNQLHWEFASTGGGDETGTNDPVITPFRGNISYSLARESIQNIIDARLPESNLPAKADFSLKNVKASNIPELYKLKPIFESCMARYSHIIDAVKMYQEAIDAIEKDKFIPILIINDSNTTGLTGSDDDVQDNYHAFFKAVGSTTKSGTTGGSFGLGKGALYDASSFSVIYGSSKFGQDEYVFQGKARLASHVLDGDNKQGNGSFGYSSQKPVRELEAIPELFRKTSQGTNIYILGFKEWENWQKPMIKSILNYFWYSIYKGLLEVTVDTITVTKLNLDSVLKEYFSIDQIDRPEEENPLPFYNTIINSNHIEYKETFESLGDVKLYFLLREDYPNKTIFIRQNGMVIQKKGQDSSLGYAGVFICDNGRGNEILRAMEDQGHKVWNKNNAKGRYDKDGNDLYPIAEKAQKDLNSFVNNSLRDLRNNTLSNKSSSIPNLEEYLYTFAKEDIMQKENTDAGNSQKEVSPTETSVEISNADNKIIDLPTKIRLAPVSILADGSIGGEFPIEGDTGDGNGGSSIGQVVNGNKAIFPQRNIKYKSFAIKNGNKEYEHIVILKSDESLQRFSIDVKAVTDDSSVPVQIIDAIDFNGRKYQVQENKVFNLSTDVNNEIRLKLRFEVKERLALNITIYANK